jgi:hypothetical protein
MNDKKTFQVTSIFGVVVSTALLISGLLQNIKMFWLLVVLDFILLHSIWVWQLAHGSRWRDINWNSFKIVLVAFAIGGNLAWILIDR